MNRFCLILFGPPGSGKGTQSKLLRQRLNWPHISTGDMLRDHVQKEDDLGREIAEIMQSGRLVPDDLVNRLVEERISESDCGQGFILDGYPRTVQQAGMLENLLERKGFEPVVVYLEVDYNRIVARLSGRRLCPQCGSLYSLASNAPQVAEVCDYCGAALTVRDDDREEVIRQRLEAYDRQTRPLLEYFQAGGYAFHGVEATDGAPQVIAKKIEEFIPAVPGVKVAPAAGSRAE
jgi:adenylate kinase